MNKTAIKNFSIWARSKLISDIQFKAQTLGVLPDGIREPLPHSELQIQFFDIGTKDYAVVKGDDVYRRAALVDALRAKARSTDYATAYRAVIEKVAYTWFNRLIAIRFMEVNDYLPGQMRVLSSRMAGKAEPDMVSEPFEGDLDFTDEEQEEIMRLKDENRLDELFRMLFIAQCHKLSEILPGLFAPKERTSPSREYYELLLSINFTDSDGIVWHLVNDIPERDFRVRTDSDELRYQAGELSEDDMPAGQVEIIGWLYQYYNTEPKDEVFTLLKKNVKITKERVPAATQLFTPDWIVRYMAENSLGRIFVNGELAASGNQRTEDERIQEEKAIAERMGWKYYIPEAAQDASVRAQLQNANGTSLTNDLQISDLKVIDPCCGSGHIAVYLFDVLMQIYEAQGWTQREAAQSIVQNNLYALDIDDRAAQLAYFAIMMKARQYDRRFFVRGVQPHVLAIPEWDEDERRGWSDELNALCSLLRDGKEFGSIIDMPSMDWSSLRMEVARMDDELGQISFASISEDTRSKLLGLIDAGEIMAQKYDVVCTNPPYMGASGMGARLSQYVKDYYPDSKSDLFAVFIERCREMAKPGGYQAMITQHAWMFLSSYEKLRKNLQKIDTICLAHLGIGVFEDLNSKVVQAVAFVMRKSNVATYKGTYDRLFEKQGLQEDNKLKQKWLMDGSHRFFVNQRNFSKIPGAPVAYWVSDKFAKIFEFPKLKTISKARRGLETGDNDRFLKFWSEVPFPDIDTSCQAIEHFSKKWLPHNKGGNYRKWYGNLELVVWFYNDGADIKKSGVLNGYDAYCKEGITWTALTSSENSFRFTPIGHTFDSNKGPLIPKIDTNDIYYLLGFFNTPIAQKVMRILNPTISLQNGDMDNLPICIDEKHQDTIDDVVKMNVSLSKQDWDSYETSWDFKRHPLL